MPRATSVDAAPAPRFASLWAALVYCVCTLALGLPALRGQFLVSTHSDQYLAGFGFREFAASQLRAGEGIPLWDPYLFGGVPYVAGMAGDIFYPTFLLRAALPTDVAMTWSFIIHVFLAGFFTYRFLRASGIAFFPALLGGVAYMMCGQVASLVSPGHDGKLYISALLPLALWMLVRGIRDGREWAWGALAIVIGLAVLSPHPQLLQYLLLACGAFALYLAFAPIEDAERADIRLDRRLALRRLGFALGAVLIGALMGAVQYLPVREYVPFSPRGGGREYEFAVAYSMPIEELLNTYLPQFSGILEHYWGRNRIHLHSEYLGAGTLLLASAGLSSTRRAFRWFWIATLIVATLWALGGYTPFYRLVYAVIPGTPYFRAPSTIFFLPSFAVAVLAALGTERALAGALRQRFVVGWLIAGAVVALLASTGAFTNLATVIAAGFPAQLSEYGQEAILANSSALVFGAWRSFLAVALVCGILWLWGRGRIPVRVAAWALVAAVAVDLFSILKTYWIFSPPASVLFAGDPAIDFVKAQPTPGRVLTFGDGTVYRDVMLNGSGMMAHRVRLVMGYHGNELGRYQELTRHYDPRILLSPTFWRHENVRYLYTNIDPETIAKVLTNIGSPAMQKLLGPVKNSSGTSIYLYQLPGDNPLAWLAPVVVKAPPEQSLATVLDPRFDPTRAAIVDTNSKLAARQIQALPEALNIPVRVSRYALGSIQLELASPPPAGSALIVSENFFPGWSAQVDGKPAALDRAQYNLIGVELPSGARSVTLSFDDKAYEKGKVVTILALAVAILVAVAGAVQSRRRPARSA